MDKKALRRQLLQQRQAMEPEDWRSRSDRICAHLGSWPPLQQARWVLGYCSVRQEPDIQALFDQGPPHWGIPRCEGKALHWHQWPRGDRATGLVTGVYGIVEPSPQLPPVDPVQVDLILVPAIAWDSQGYRLGYGGGYYDRLLSQPPWDRIPTLAILFDPGRIPALPHDPWDRPLWGACTETGIHGWRGKAPSLAMA